MKHLILCAIACLFFLSSCFEKEEGVTVVPTENNVMECESVKTLIQDALEKEPSEPRAYIDKYLYKEQYVFVLEEGGEVYPDKLYTIINSKCEVVCYSGGIGGFICQDFDKAKFIETIWKDNR